ncbi:CDP-diacylglycerol--serine O-phosphatidyltransferase [Dysgonomonas sp. 521]|uniref:CDP-alcohol phosphatidyltransferase family protein n=1 Tax=Dysgonomonas sp. 521 TaxID=2302932 RepID=UPI0013D17758|nr:CDP-alcohol phosphatidyltransferase family protein [Dysgonomonas sp. 521]NDV93817.1 CDP-diacylglycerol--serine O-phosphatidyltransferase [Dysgonomonas sp. 521]
MKKHIPNILTCCSLLSGCIATVMAFQGEFFWVVVWVIVAAFFDFSDGFAARALKAYSPMGKELDSLSDDISFGLAPSVAVFRFLSDNMTRISENQIIVDYLPYMAFLLAVFSALRLAKFNIDERQSESFIGLNTPANALFWVSFCYGLTHNVPVITPTLMYTIMAAIVVFSLLMVSEIPMFSLKIKSLKLKGNEHRYFLAVAMIALVAWIGILGIAGGILLYITLSILQQTGILKK